MVYYVVPWTSNPMKTVRACLSAPNNNKRYNMCICSSCGDIMSSYEMLREIELEDGTKVPESFCTDCLGRYVHNVEDLDIKDYAFGYITDSFNIKFDKYEE